MECPKCHKNIKDGVTVCPHCHKVLALVCPNCHSLGQSPVCEDCGYIILTKCSKCGRVVSTDSEQCKCGLQISKSLGINECESDEFAALSIKFDGLKNIRRVLASKELFNKFNIKLLNILKTILKNIEGCVIKYDNSYVINFNKELSFATSAVKAVKLALRIINAYTYINQNTSEELGLPLKLNITLVKKQAEELLKNINTDNNIKLLNIDKNEQKHLKGMQVIVDQNIQDVISKDYQTDSLYTVEKNSTTIMFYKIILNKYVLPPNKKTEDISAPKKNNIKNNAQDLKQDDKRQNDFKVFDINAKCKFIKTNPIELFTKIDNSKIISIRAENDLQLLTSDIIKYYTKQNKKILYAICNEETQYKPWGVFEQLIRDFWNLSSLNALNNPEEDFQSFQSLKTLLYEKPRKSSTPEDARFAYMEDFSRFFSSLKNYTIIIDGFENIDDTTVQTLRLYFDNYKHIVPNFVFITNKDVSVHSKIKNLLRTNLYTEYTVSEVSMDDAVSVFSEDATDFINSFYFEKIKENFAGSLLYFKHAIKFLNEKDVLIDFENKLLIKNNNSVLIPTNIVDLMKARLKALGETNMQASMILAFSAYLGHRLDSKMMEFLGVSDVDKNFTYLQNAGFGFMQGNFFIINNYNVLKKALDIAIKQEIKEYLCKTIFVKFGKVLDSTRLAILFGKLGMLKDKYLVLWKISTISIACGDYDAYLKSCLAFLAIIDKIGENIPKEDIEDNKKDVFQNILMSLYNYSPEKIYSIENILLMDAIRDNDDERIVKLSNLMLQGALISANYTDALNLLHNILTRLPHPTLIVDNAINSKFLLLSLVHIEILFNIGDYEQAIDIAIDILSVIRPDLLDEIKPAGFSLNLFIGHLIETFTLVCIAKLFILDDDIEEFINQIGIIIGIDLPDKDCILAIRDTLAGKKFIPSNIEEASPFSKVLYLILQEFDEHKNDYKTFAQNIYQAKLLASDIHQAQLEYFCDALIGYSYAKIGAEVKAETIYNDIITKAEKSGIFSTVLITRYLKALLKISQNSQEEALNIINDSLALIQRYHNQAKIFYAMFENLFIKMAQNGTIDNVDTETEIKKLLLFIPNGSLNILLNDLNNNIAPTNENADETTYSHQGEEA